MRRHRPGRGRTIEISAEGRLRVIDEDSGSDVSAQLQCRQPDDGHQFQSVFLIGEKLTDANAGIETLFQKAEGYARW